MELRHRHCATIAVLATAVIAGGCSWSAGDPTSVAATTDVPSSIPTVSMIPDDTGDPITLRIEVTTARAPEHRVYTLRCNPVGGTLPQAARACRGYHWLAAHTHLPRRCAELPESFLKHAASRITGDAGGRPVRFDVTLRTLCSVVSRKHELVELAALSGLPRHIVSTVPAASIEYSVTNTLTNGP